MAEKKVTTIPATISKSMESYSVKPKKRRVAGYARVSTDHDDQLSSYQAQVDYYTNYINKVEDWEFVGIYTDEGISATNTNRREGFKAMIADAKAGKIDLIVTKSVSRFARNTVDSLTAVRELRSIGVEIFFEKENIWTLDSKGELLITIMSSLAQEESRSISENVTWGHRKRFADGKVMIPFSNVLGFERGKDGELVVNKEEAEIVRMIFRMFLEGMTPHAIAKELTKRGIKSPMGKDTWWEGTVRRMLSNEKYKGDALLQKVFTVDFLQKKLKKNEGEVQQYYVQNDHEAIISPEVFDMVQNELERRSRDREAKYSGVSIYSNRIKCGCCGGWYGAKVWHSNNAKYRKIVYRCNNKYVSEKCDTPNITEKDIQSIFMQAINIILSKKSEIIDNLLYITQVIYCNNELKEKEKAMKNDIESILNEINAFVMDNAKTVSDQEIYQGQYRILVCKYDSLMGKYDRLKSEINARNIRLERIRMFIRELKKHKESISEFDSALWSSLLEHIIINKNEATVVFRDGSSVNVAVK